jgi:hypothetical protein
MCRFLRQLSLQFRHLAGSSNEWERERERSRHIYLSLSPCLECICLSCPLDGDIVEKAACVEKLVKKKNFVSVKKRTTFSTFLFSRAKKSCTPPPRRTLEKTAIFSHSEINAWKKVLLFFNDQIVFLCQIDFFSLWNYFFSHWNYSFSRWRVQREKK